MTKLLEQAIDRVRSLSASEQDAAAGLLLEFIEQPAQSVLTDEQLAEVRIAVQEAREGQFASEQELEALWRKFDR